MQLLVWLDLPLRQTILNISFELSEINENSESLYLVEVVHKTLSCAIFFYSFYGFYEDIKSHSLESESE